MSDIVFECIRVAILLYLVFYLVRAGKRRSEQLCWKGWYCLLGGFMLLLFGSVMDVTDNFQSLSRFIIIGETPAQAFLEKIVGFTGGFALLTLGLIRWISRVTNVEHNERLYKELGKEVAERKEAEEKIREAERKFRLLYDSSSDAIMLLNEKRFFDCNEATLGIFGCANKEEFCSKHPADLSPATQPCGTDSMTLANERIATATKTGSARFEWVHKRMDGTEFPAEVLLNMMILNGEKILQAVVRDISERKENEEKLKKTLGELERFNTLMIGREGRVIEMKKEVNVLLAELGRPLRYQSVLEGEEADLSC